MCFQVFREAFVSDVVACFCPQTTQRGTISPGSCIRWDPPAPKWSSEGKLWSWSASLRACKSAPSFQNKRKADETAQKSTVAFGFQADSRYLLAEGRRRAAQRESILPDLPENTQDIRCGGSRRWRLPLHGHKQAGHHTPHH